MAVVTVVGVFGVVVLLTIAVIIGYADARARDDAWRRIAETRRALRDLEQALIAVSGEPMCATCPVRRYLSDRYGD